MNNLITCFLSMFLFATSLFGQGVNSKVAEANKLFEEQKYDEANTKYRDALVDHPESDILHFNIGDVQYKKNNYEEALKSYQKALSSEDVLMQSRNYYNMGNTLYKMGKLPESILHYRKALELNPEDEDAKYNLEYVRAKLKDESQKQNQDQNKEQQQDQQQQNQQDQQDQEQQENQQQQEGKQQEEQQNQQQNEDEKEPQEEEQQQQGEPKDISKEDAERILNALKNEEEDLLKNKKAKKVKGAFRGKDW